MQLVGFPSFSAWVGLVGLSDGISDAGRAIILCHNVGEANGHRNGWTTTFDIF